MSVVSKIRIKKANRVRRKLRASGKMRLTVFRSSKHIYAQIIDDRNGVTIVSANSLHEDIAGKFSSFCNKDVASAIGSIIAKKGIDAGVKDVVFDRGSFLYHGKIKALADAAREAGLVF